MSAYIKFAYACFIRPFLPISLKEDNNESTNDNDDLVLTASGKAHQAKLERFYEAQADAYDESRGILLKGREEMLESCASYLINLKKNNKVDGDNVNNKDENGCWIWLDIGGGTGYNIECMNQFMDIRKMFRHIYLIDLTPSLCNEARKRFSRLGWDDDFVHVVCADAGIWDVPEDIMKQQGGKVMLNTFSYSLSMMPLPVVFEVIDKTPVRLSPGGICGVVDFLAESKSSSSYPLYSIDVGAEGKEENRITQQQYVVKKGGNRYVGYISRLFWQFWFELDGVHLHPCRRDYIMHMMSRLSNSCTLKVIYGINYWCGIPLVQIPYYYWIGIPNSLPGYTPTISSKGSDGEDRKLTTSNGSTLLYAVSGATVLGAVASLMFTPNGMEVFSPILSLFGRYPPRSFRS